jgi:hypothetical protein
LLSHVPKPNCGIECPLFNLIIGTIVILRNMLSQNGYCWVLCSADKSVLFVLIFCIMRCLKPCTPAYAIDYVLLLAHKSVHTHMSKVVCLRNSC